MKLCWSCHRNSSGRPLQGEKRQRARKKPGRGSSCLSAEWAHNSFLLRTQVLAEHVTKREGPRPPTVQVRVVPCKAYHVASRAWFECVARPTHHLAHAQAHRRDVRYHDITQYLYLPSPRTVLQNGVFVRFCHRTSHDALFETFSNLPRAVTDHYWCQHLVHCILP